jgi:translation initiation factor IF-3
MNLQIRISPVRVIDQNNVQVGVIDTSAALQLAREAGLDLVEVDPNAKPPVCRIQDYGKTKYEKSKQEIKEIRLRPRIDRHDLDFKVKHAREFLEKADKVQFTMRFRGMREMHHMDLGMEVMRSVAEQLGDVSKVETDVRREGRRISILLAPLPEIQRKVAAERKAREKAKEKERLARAAAGLPPIPEPEPEPEPVAAEYDDDGPDGEE